MFVWCVLSRPHTSSFMRSPSLLAIEYELADKLQRSARAITCFEEHGFGKQDLLEDKYAFSQRNFDKILWHGCSKITLIPFLLHLRLQTSWQQHQPVSLCSESRDLSSDSDANESDGEGEKVLSRPSSREHESSPCSMKCLNFSTQSHVHMLAFTNTASTSSDVINAMNRLASARAASSSNPVQLVRVMLSLQRQRRRQRPRQIKIKIKGPSSSTIFALLVAKLWELPEVPGTKKQLTNFVP